MSERDLSLIGRRLPRVDARDKVRGQALFTDDHKRPGMLHGLILRSPRAHARIVHIDTTRAAALPGVAAVVSGADTLGIRYGVISRSAKFCDEPALALDRVRFIGEEVAAVAAADPDAAREALDLIRVDYEDLPAVFDPEEARRPGAPQLHDHAPGNISREYHLLKGDPEAVFNDCYLVREDVFTTQSASHAYLEPRAALAWWEGGRLTVITSTQTPYYVQQHLGLTLGLNPDAIRVIKPRVGGGFGGKSDGMSAVEFSAALLSRTAGRPVKIVCSRDEEFHAARRKHPTRVTMKTGVDKTGRILARTSTAILDGGAYCSLGPLTTVLMGTFQTLPFKFDHFRYDGFRIYTNKPPCGAMRGHGGPQVHFAQDVQLDLIAEELGLDPVELALRNGLKTGDESAAGFKIVSSGFAECLTRVAERSGWREKRRPPRSGISADGRTAFGIGLGCGGFPSGAGFYFNQTTSAHSSVIIKAGEGGGLSVFTGASDIGQGSDSVVTTIVAEVLGLSPEDIRLTAADTLLTPPDMGTYSSRVTVAAGNAALAAAENFREKLFEAVAEKLEARADDLVAKNGRIGVQGSPDQSVTFTEAVNIYQAAHRGAPLVAQGSYNSPDPLSPTYSFGAYVAEVAVDLRTGQVKVLDYHVGHDCGRALNPMSVEGQIEGCIGMGLGYALSEELRFDGGQTLNPSFLGYGLPLAVNMPGIAIDHVETEDPHGPFGAKETGEGSLDPVAPAVVNAIYNATGVRLTDLPVTPAKILKGLRELKQGRNGGK